MKTLFILFTLIYSSLAQTSIINNNTTDKNVNHYSSMMSITSDANYGFTITYKNYYKVIENSLAKKTYCVVCCGQPTPDECPSDGTFSNITSVGIDKGAYGVIPFLELIGVDNKIVNAEFSLGASPCFKGNQNLHPDITFTTQENTTSGTHVSFSAQRNDLTPLQKAAWLMYVGAFFEQELLATTMFTYIDTVYKCHKDNLGYQSTQKTVAWTSYDSQQNAFTIYRDSFFNELVKDAGGRLVAANSAQDNVYLMNNSEHVFYFLQGLKGADYILDMSSTSLTYDNWITPINATIHTTVIGLPPAIENNNIYSVNGLVKESVSDWTQRAAARPDMALLDLMHLLYPTMEMPSNNYPVWITHFSNTNGTEYQHKMDTSKYGTCGNITSNAFDDTRCSPNGHRGTIQAKPLTPGDKAGISVGTIIAGILAALAGVWLFKRYRRRQRRHQFYKMQEL